MVSAVLIPKALAGSFFCQDDAVAAGRVAAHRHWEVAQLRVVQQLHRGVKAVQITVKDDTVHRALPPY